MPRRSKKPRHTLPKGAVPDPLVDSGNPSYRDQARATAHPTRPRHRLVALATRSPGRGTPRSPQRKNATVMLEHVTEKWKPVFRKRHATTKGSRRISIQSNRD